MTKIEEKVEQLVKEPIEKLGYNLYDLFPEIKENL